MHGKRANILIVIEGGQLFSYELDNKNSWEIGRPTKDHIPDIKLHSATVSRKHGKFQNMDGVWFYLDYNGKNGTFYNHKKVEAGRNGNIKPILLENGDTFVFGGGEEEAINAKTVWAMYLTRAFDEDWRVVDTKGYEILQFISGGRKQRDECSRKRFCVREGDGNRNIYGRFDLCDWRLRGGWPLVH